MPACVVSMYDTKASAHRSPSIAADTMPPAYPAPSPHGTSPFILICWSVALSRMILTGAEVRVSHPISTASLVRKPCDFLPNSMKPLRRRSDISGGKSLSMRALCMPGAYEVAGREDDVLPLVRSSSLCAGRPASVVPARYESSLHLYKSGLLYLPDSTSF